MITVTYTCDCCLKRSLTPDNMINIAINYNSASYGHGSNFYAKLWCADCCNRFQLHWQDPSAPIDMIVTLEDVVREIVREEINATR